LLRDKKVVGVFVRFRAPLQTRRRATVKIKPKKKNSYLTFLRKNLNFGLDENLTLTSQTSSDKNIRNKDTRGDTTENNQNQTPKIMKIAPYFSKKKQILGWAKLTYSSPNLLNKNIRTRNTRGTRPKTTVKIKPQKNEKSTLLSKKNLNFGLDKTPNPRLVPNLLRQKYSNKDTKARPKSNGQNQKNNEKETTLLF
jgi:hypothetical protein